MRRLPKLGRRDLADHHCRDMRYEGHRTKHTRRKAVRYEGHRTKHTHEHTRRHNHGHPSPPNARHPGNVQDATAPMPTETGRSVRHMRRRLPKLIRSCRLTATLGLPAQPELQAGAQAWATRFFGTHERRGRARPGGVATRGTVLRGHLTTGASRRGPGGSQHRVW